MPDPRRTVVGRLASKQQKALLYVLQDGVCPECHQRMETWDAHHVVPWSKGRKTETENL